jgi:hypothetical protein
VFLTSNPENTMTTIATTTPEITQTLRRIAEDEPNTIRAFVAQEALDYHNGNPAQMFIDLQRGGCQAGTISSLIWYTDTHAFFDLYYGEIDELREQIEEDTCEPLQIQGDLKTFFTYVAFEEIAYRMASDDLGLEL